jgi:HD-GYP domain-containing protein (c-di-GMP phosphodiesterase class II)
LKDLGCSSNAARICELYLTDDLNFKHDYKTVGDSLPQVLGFVLKHTGLKAGLAERFRSVMTILRDGPEIARDLVATRCQRGAEIARCCAFPKAWRKASIRSTNISTAGQAGAPGRRRRFRLFAHRPAGPGDRRVPYRGRAAALREVRLRAGQWFDPAWCGLRGGGAIGRVLDGAGIARDRPGRGAMQPQGRAQHPLDDDYLDDIATAFGQVVDAKSPYTSGHSARVALYTDMIGEALGLSMERRRWLKRGALLHDVGKLGVSNSVLDKAGALDRAEWDAVKPACAIHRDHPRPHRRLPRTGAIAGAHHERLDGSGYPRGLNADHIDIETRIITTADIFDAITATRPYRGAIPIPQALEMMAKTVGSALDPACFDALTRAVERVPFPEAA